MMNRYSSVSGRHFYLTALAALFLVLFLLCSLAACGDDDRDLPNNEERPSTDNPPRIRPRTIRTRIQRKIPMNNRRRIPMQICP